jgi:[acyl-carrier-protein] S-malonyltransferase
MGRDLLESYPAARQTFEAADDILGIDLTDICFNGPEEKLRETRYTQLAILVHSVAAWRVIEGSGFRPAFVAGHSVGEYSALVAAGALSFMDAARLVKIRAQAMFDSGVKTPGAMAALIGLSPDGLDSLIGEAAEAGIVVPANFNSPVQVVVSGEVAAIEKVLEIAKEHGARRAIRLNVSGAFHSPLMESGQHQLVEALSSVDLADAAIPVVANVTADAVTARDEIAGLLQRQLTSPVLWSQSMVYLLEHGVKRFVEVGPGNVLCGLLKRIEPGSECLACSDRQGIGELIGEVKA